MKLVESSDSHIAATNPIRYVREAVRRLSIRKLKSCMVGCQACPCHCGTKTIPFGTGSIPLMCIMDYPTEQQAMAGKPIGMFDGANDVAQLLQEVFDPYNVDLNKVFFMNTVSCAPMRAVPKADGTTEGVPRTPVTQEIQQCSLFVKYALDIIHPPMLIIMGNVASNVFVNEPISKAHGRWASYYGIPAKLTYSPRQVLEAKGQASNADWAQMDKSFREEVGNALEQYKQLWGNSVLFK